MNAPTWTIVHFGTDGENKLNVWGPTNLHNSSPGPIEAFLKRNAGHGDTVEDRTQHYFRGVLPVSSVVDQHLLAA